jgi:hypothetical protein
MSNQYNSNKSNDNNEVFTPTVKSAYKFFNSNSAIDNTCMSFNFWNNLLKISISPIIVKEGSANRVDTDNHIDIYLSPKKAMMLLHVFEMFRQNPDAYKNIGVGTNKGIIYVANGKNTFGEGGTCIVISLIDNETGNKQGEAAYEFNCTDDYAITDYLGGSDFGKDYSYSKDIELDAFETLLKSFINASTNAIAASIMDANKFNEARTFSFIKDAREKLGIPRNDSGSNKNYNRSSWFNNNNGNGSVSDSTPRNNNTSSYDEVMNDIASIMD